MHTIGQIVKFDDRREFQNRTEFQHMHVPIYVGDCPGLDENIDKYITLAFQMGKNTVQWMNC